LSAAVTPLVSSPGSTTQDDRRTWARANGARADEAPVHDAVDPSQAEPSTLAEATVALPRRGLLAPRAALCGRARGTGRPVRAGADIRTHPVGSPRRPRGVIHAVPDPPTTTLHAVALDDGKAGIATGVRLPHLERRLGPHAARSAPSARCVEHQPIDPSIWSVRSRFSSTAYSIGSSLVNWSKKPLTMSALAAVSLSPRLCK
jgi:hypothetical protein